MYPTAEAPYYGIFVRDQADALRERGVDVELVFINGRASKFAYLASVKQIADRLRGGGIDLIHCHHTFAAWVALAARRLAGVRIPLVLSFHEGEVFAPRATPAPRTWKWLKRFAIRRADFVIPVERRMLAAVLGDDASLVRHEVIPAGIDLDAFTPGDRAAARQRLGWPPGDLILFFPFAQNKPAKRHDLASEVRGILRWEGKRVRLVTGGSIAHDAMPDALRACDALLLLSDYEASPTVVKEALACERPVVATDVGDIRERYGDLPGVRIVPPDIEDISEAVQELIEIGQPFGGRERIERLGLTTGRTADRIIGVYRGILSQALSD